MHSVGKHNIFVQYKSFVVYKFVMYKIKFAVYKFHNNFMMKFKNKTNYSRLSEQDKNDLLQNIKQFSNSKEWPQNLKNKIIRELEDKQFKQILKDAWVKQQLKEQELDPLEDKVISESGTCLANRNWKCNAKTCNYQPYRGNAQQLAIKVSTIDCSKLAGKKLYACLMHYIVTGKQRKYCHNYFKLHKELPEGAFLNLNAEIQSDVTATSVLVQNLQPSTSKTGTP